MTTLTLNYPVADISGNLKIIASQCDSGFLDPGAGLPHGFDEENIDIIATLSIIESVTNRKVSSTGLMRIDTDDEYEIETPQYILGIRDAGCGPAEWSDGARKVPLHSGTVTFCPYGHVKAGDKKGGLFLAIWMR